MIGQWKKSSPTGKPINVHEEMRELVMKIMAGCLFRLNDPGVLKQLKMHFATGNDYVSHPSPFNLPAWMPNRSKSTLRATITYIDNVLLSLMNHHNPKVGGEETLLGYLHRQKGEDGSALPNEDILAEAKNIFVSGYFSTSDVLSWLLYSIAQHREWAGKIYGECRHFDQSAVNTSFDSSFHTQLFIHEVLRCYPPVWASSHQTLQSLHWGKYCIPKGATVLTSIYNLHHHPAGWKDAETFNPLRFAVNDLDEKALFVPFGMGPRKCAGISLAKMIINIVFAKVVSNFHLKIDDMVPASIQSRVTLGSKNDLQIFIEPR